MVHRTPYMQTLGESKKQQISRQNVCKRDSNFLCRHSHSLKKRRKEHAVYCTSPQATDVAEGKQLWTWIKRTFENLLLSWALACHANKVEHVKYNGNESVPTFFRLSSVLGSTRRVALQVPSGFLYRRRQVKKTIKKGTNVCACRVFCNANVTIKTCFLSLLLWVLFNIAQWHVKESRCPYDSCFNICLWNSASFYRLDWAYYIEHNVSSYFIFKSRLGHVVLRFKTEKIYNW